MNKRNKLVALPLVIFLLSSISGFNQITRSEVTGQINAIQTGVPFLTIAPDSRAGGMGDIGVATSPDISSQHWNPAKYAFIEGSGGVSLRSEERRVGKECRSRWSPYH